MTRLSIIFPCYNESENIKKILNRVEVMLSERQDTEIILVDNGSTDSTSVILSEILDTQQSSIIRTHRIEENIGYGHGIMEGVRIAKGEVIAWTHADLQTDPNDVLEAYDKFMLSINSGKFILKGKRIGRPWLDNLFTTGMSAISTFFLRVHLSDVNAQPKMFHRSFLENLPNPPLDFSLDLYLLYQARTCGFDILEHSVLFGQRIHGQAKGGGSLKGKWKLIKRTWNYIMELRKRVMK